VNLFSLVSNNFTILFESLFHDNDRSLLIDQLSFTISISRYFDCHSFNCTTFWKTRNSI
jgi:hypothetical protein